MEEAQLAQAQVEVVVVELVEEALGLARVVEEVLVGVLELVQPLAEEAVEAILEPAAALVVEVVVAQELELAVRVLGSVLAVVAVVEALALEPVALVVVAEVPESVQVSVVEEEVRETGVADLPEPAVGLAAVAIFPAGYVGLLPELGMEEAVEVEAQARAMGKATVAVAVPAQLLVPASRR